MIDEIPKKIWQTHMYPDRDSLPLYMKGPSFSWSELNPDFSYRYISKEERESFISEYHDKDWLLIFRLADSQITQSEIWRLLCLYEDGGVYADIDTVCINEIQSFVDMRADFVIESWVVNNSQDGSNQNNRLITDTEGVLREVTNSVFATKPHGRFISLLVKTIKEKCLNQIASGNLNIHIDLTGPQSYAGTYMSNHEAKEYARFFDQENIIELTGSVNWNDFRRTSEPFRFSELDSAYGDISLDTQNEIKFFRNSGHGGFTYDK
jgi:hypothetical protein